MIKKNRIIAASLAALTAFSLCITPVKNACALSNEASLVASSTASASNKGIPDYKVGAKLTGQNLTAYTQLKAQIEKVASGNLSSTEFNIPVSAFLGDKLYYKKSELISLTGCNADIESLKAAMVSLFDFDSTTVAHALIYDLPYELYWFDKTISVTLITPGFKYGSDGSYFYFPNDSVVTFKFYASADYSKSGKTNTCTIDTTKTKKSAKLVKKKVTQILNAAKELSDYEALCYFKDQITNSTSYNENTGLIYGDSSQLVYVFDDNEKTSVVCEGYSKAMQYLCDLHTFKGDVHCISVGGSLDEISSVGNHMWNIITINGKNYMADLTNSDTGKVGENSSLFLRGEYGPLENGYQIYLNSAMSLSYIYDKQTMNLFSKDELAITDNDYNFSTTGYLLGKVTTTGKRTLNISWHPVEGATKYIIYGCYCGSKTSTNTLKKLATITPASLKATPTAALSSFLKSGVTANKKVTYSKNLFTYKISNLVKGAGTGFRFEIRAYKGSTLLTKSLDFHVLSGGSGKTYANATEITSPMSNFMYAGKKYNIKYELTIPSGKHLYSHVADVRYIIEDTSILTVNDKGVFTAKKAGKTKVYLIAPNGIWSLTEITVK